VQQELLDLFGLSHDHLIAADRNRVAFAIKRDSDLIAEKAHELMREDLVLVCWERASASMKIFPRRWRGVSGRVA